MKVLLFSVLLLAVTTLPYTSSQVLSDSHIVTRSSIMERLMESNSQDLFKAYHLLFKKEYDLSSPEGVKRKQVFEENVKLIKETNAQNLSYKLGINQFSDLSKAEFKAKYLTLKKSDVDTIFSREILQYNEPFDYDLVGCDMAIDWSKNFIPARQQGGCGSCWAFATAGTIEGNYDINFPSNNKISFSPQYLVDCDTNWNAGCDGGDPGTAFRYIINNGIPYENAYNYKGVQQNCNTSAIKNKVVTKVESCRNCSKEQLKGLLTRGPLSVVIDGSEIQQYSSGIFSSPCYEINHAVIMAGATLDKEGNGYYLVRNSWDVDWGEKGYIRVKATTSGQSCFLENSALLPTVQKSDAPIPDPPAPQCAKVYTEIAFKGVPYEICGNTPVVPTSKTGSFEIGKFKIAKLFTGANCSGSFYSLNSSWDNFTGYPLMNGLRSIMVDNDPTPPAGCIWIFDNTCLSGQRFEICASVKDLSTVDNKKGWNKLISSVAVGGGIRYTLVTVVRTPNGSSTSSTTRNSHTYALNSTFFKKVDEIRILPA